MNRTGVTGGARSTHLLEERDVREDGIGFVATCAAMVVGVGMGGTIGRGARTRRTIQLLQDSLVVLQLSSTLLLE